MDEGSAHLNDVLSFFPPETWNHYDATLATLTRSSNLAEGWHNGWRSLVQHSNPVIWTFLGALLEQQAETELQIADWMMRKPAPTGHTKFREARQTRKWRSSSKSMIMDFIQMF